MPATWVGLAITKQPGIALPSHKSPVVIRTMSKASSSQLLIVSAYCSGQGICLQGVGSPTGAAMGAAALWRFSVINIV